MNFLQNGSKIPQDAVPVNYNIQPVNKGQEASNFLDRLNPMNWFKEQLQSNPQMKQVMDIVNENGGDAKTAFYNECKKRGADPDQVLQQVKNHPLFQKLMK
jgi:hypothetical protein